MNSRGSVYFLGIGGIGMSALARYFMLQGFSVSGYDKTPTPLTDKLICEGMQIHFREDVSLLPLSPEYVIYTPAIPKDHSELIYYREHGTPMYKRAEILGVISRHFKTIAVAGTHGKTSTSTMIAHILQKAGLSPLAFLGGISKNYGTNFLPGPGTAAFTNLKAQQAGKPLDDLFNDPHEANVDPTYCVVEADEYDRSFLQLTPFIAIITSADADHLDIYGSHDDLLKTFSEFTAGIPAGGSLILKTGTSVIPDMMNNYNIYDYSLTGSTLFSAKNIRNIEGQLHFDFFNPGEPIYNLILGVPGRFNLENAVAALAVGYLLGIGTGILREALKSYSGVQRRFDVRIRREGMVYIDDYAHHPEELKACIGAVKEMYPGKRITGVFQPHLYSRTRDLADGFARSLELLDELILLDIYPAREAPIEGVTAQILLDRTGTGYKKLVQKKDLLSELKQLKPEILLTLGAGDIDQFVAPITEFFSSAEDK